MRAADMHKVLDALKRHFDATPEWALKMENRIMAAVDDLKAAIADLATELASNNAEIETLLTKITAPGTSDADVAAAVAQIRGLISDNKAEVDKAKAAAP